MTLLASIRLHLSTLGYTPADIKAIIAIFHALPYTRHLHAVSSFSKDYAELDLPEKAQKCREQIDAIARTYQTAFLDARKNDPKISGDSSNEK